MGPTAIATLTPPPSFPLVPSWANLEVDTLLPEQLELAGTKRTSFSSSGLVDNLLPTQCKKVKIEDNASSIPPAAIRPSFPQHDESINATFIKAILANDLLKADALLPYIYPNLQNVEGNTLLMLALRLKHIHLAREMLLHSSINILLENKQQKNAFFYLDTLPFSAEHILLTQEMAILRAQQIPEELINQSNDGQTLLCSAILTENFPAFQILIERGADVNILDTDHNTLFMLAIKQNYLPVINVLVFLTNNLDQQNEVGNTALMLAIQGKHLQIASTLMKYPINTFLTNVWQENAFTSLAQQGYHYSHQHFVLTKEMVRRAAKQLPFIPELKIDGSNTLLGLAAELNEVKVLKKLIAKDADFTLPNQEGNTPLMLAIKQGHLLAADLLSSLPNKLDQQNQEGDTALMLAVRLGQLQIATILMTDPDQLNIFLSNWKGENALSLALHNTIVSTRQAFLLANSVLACAVSSISSEEINYKVEGHTSLLCLAVGLNNMRLVKQLLDKGADINIANQNGDTPIMLAIRNKQLLLTHVLFSKEPNLFLQNKKGETAYSLALENSWDIFSKCGDDLTTQ
jgi:ankyrin repeat protein